MMDELTIGDYVLATKYSDGDPHDHFCVGFYAGLTRTDPPYNPPRYDVVDNDGNQFRGNGFRRLQKISRERGDFLVAHLKDIEQSHHSVWWWARCKMSD